jgi:hypothetical protein
VADTVRTRRLDVEPLSFPVVARVVSISSISANTALTSGVRRISMRAAGVNAFYSVGVTSQTATLTGHFIANGERLDIAVPPTSPNIAIVCAASTSGTLYITELSQ